MFDCDIKEKVCYCTINSLYCNQPFSYSSMPRLLCCSQTGNSFVKNVTLAYYYHIREVDCNIVSWNRVILLHGRCVLIVSSFYYHVSTRAAWNRQDFIV